MMENQIRENHILRRYNPTHYPRVQPEEQLPNTVNLRPNADYPRVTMKNLQGADRKYHHQALRSTLKDAVVRSTQGPANIPVSPMPNPVRWTTTRERIDSGTTLLAENERSAYNGQTCLLIPVMELKRPSTSIDRLVLLILVTINGVRLFNPFEHRTARALKNLLEDGGVIKVFLNATNELQFLWVLLGAACKNVFCITSHVKSIVTEEGLNWRHLYSPEDSIPKFNVLLNLRNWTNVCIRTERQVRINEGGVIENLKSDSLLQYVAQVGNMVMLLGRRSRVSSKVLWIEAIDKIRHYISNSLYNVNFWTLVAEAIRNKLNLHVFLPLILSVCIREQGGNMSNVTFSRVNSLYLRVVNLPRAANAPRAFNVNLCVKSSLQEISFVQCMQLPRAERAVGLNECGEVGCFMDIWNRINFDAPVFVQEWLHSV